MSHSLRPASLLILGLVSLLTVDSAFAQPMPTPVTPFATWRKEDYRGRDSHSLDAWVVKGVVKPGGEYDMTKPWLPRYVGPATGTVQTHKTAKFQGLSYSLREAESWEEAAALNYGFAHAKGQLRGGTGDFRSEYTNVKNSFHMTRSLYFELNAVTQHESLIAPRRTSAGTHYAHRITEGYRMILKLTITRASHEEIETFRSNANAAFFLYKGSGSIDESRLKRNLTATVSAEGLVWSGGVTIAGTPIKPVFVSIPQINTFLAQLRNGQAQITPAQIEYEFRSGKESRLSGNQIVKGATHWLRMENISKVPKHVLVGRGQIHALEIFSRAKSIHHGNYDPYSGKIWLKVDDNAAIQIDLSRYPVERGIPTAPPYSDTRRWIIPLNAAGLQYAKRVRVYYEPGSGHAQFRISVFGVQRDKRQKPIGLPVPSVRWG